MAYSSTSKTGSAGANFVWLEMTSATANEERQLQTGGQYSLYIDGTFDGATVKIGYSPKTAPTKGIEETSGTEFSVTAPISGKVIYGMASGWYVKPLVTGGTAPSINMYLSPVGED